jgi:hypothetical protein
MRNSVVKEQVPLVYFYGGAPIPDYGDLTLRHMVSRWNGSVVVLHSEPVANKVRGVLYLRYTDWYNTEPFEKFRRVSPLEENFRQGFWLLTAERFFVLQQWAERSGVHRFLHAELDVALYDVQALPTILDSVGTGLFYPRASGDYSGASLMYVNSLSVLSQFLRFAQSNALHGSEMRVLAEFHRQHPEVAFALPSHSSIDFDLGVRKSWAGIEAGDAVGIIDVGALGTWVLGNDRRNVGRRPVYNKDYVDGHGNELFAGLTFHYSPTRQELSVTAPNAKRLKISALHIHSKAMHIAFSPLRLWLAVWQLRLPWRMPVVFQYVSDEAFRVFRALLDYVYVRVFKNR